MKAAEGFRLLAETTQLARAVFADGWRSLIKETPTLKTNHSTGNHQVWLPERMSNVWASNYPLTVVTMNYRGSRKALDIGRVYKRSSLAVGIWFGGGMVKVFSHLKEEFDVNDDIVCRSDGIRHRHIIMTQKRKLIRWMTSHAFSKDLTSAQKAKVTLLKGLHVCHCPWISETWLCREEAVECQKMFGEAIRRKKQKKILKTISIFYSNAWSHTSLVRNQVVRWVGYSMMPNPPHKSDMALYDDHTFGPRIISGMRGCQDVDTTVYFQFF